MFDAEEIERKTETHHELKKQVRKVLDSKNLSFLEKETLTDDFMSAIHEFINARM